MDIPSLKLPIYAANKLLAPLYWLLVVIKCLIKFSPPKKNLFFLKFCVCFIFLSICLLLINMLRLKI